MISCHTKKFLSQILTKGLCITQIKDGMCKAVIYVVNDTIPMVKLAAKMIFTLAYRHPDFSPNI